MKLEPVFLVAPQPESEPRPGLSRRAFLLSVATAFAAGSVLGVTLDRLVTGGTNRRPSSATPSDGVRWALDVQQRGLSELVRYRESFLVVFGDEDADVLLPGVERLCVAVLEDDEAVSEIRAQLARVLIAIIEKTPAAAPLAALVPSLRRIA